MLKDAFKLSFEISPIIMTGGIASSIPGGMLPVLSLANALSFATGLLSEGDDFNLDSAFAHFQVLPGSTLIDYKIGMYPFANQNVAANAVIKQPLTVDMLMICPSNSKNGYLSKLATIQAMQASFDQHNLSGGTYTVATPAYIYPNMIMTSMVNADRSDSKQVQSAYKLSFVKPLVTLADAQQAQNSMMSQITAGVPSTGATSGLGPTIGSPPSLATPSIAPAAQNTAGSSAAGTQWI